MKRTIKKMTTMLIASFVCLIIMLLPSQASAALNSNVNKLNLISKDNMQMVNAKYNQDQKIKAYFEEKYGKAVNAEYNEENAVVTKILVEDPDHSMYISKYSVGVYYRYFYTNPFEYYYSDLTWQINDSITVEETEEGWLISLPLDWGLSEIYYININTDEYAFSKRIDSSMSNEIINISPDQNYVNVNVNIDGGDGQFTVNNMNLSMIDENGVAFPLGYFYSNAKILPGKYNISVTGKDNSNTYSLFKKNLDLSPVNSNVNFNKDELSKITFNLHDTSGKNAILESINFDKYDDYYYSSSVDVKDIPNIYASKENYDSIGACYSIKENENQWRYYVSKQDIEIKDANKEIDFGTKFTASIKLDKEQYRAEDKLDYGSFKITDEYENTLEQIYDNNDKQVNGVVEIKGENNFIQSYTSSFLDNLNAPLPTKPGNYEVTFYVEEQPIKPINIIKAEAQIKVFQSENKVIFTISDPTHSQYVSQYSINIAEKSSNDSNYYYESLYDIDKYAIKTDSGWEVRIYDLDWTKDNKYKVFINAQDTLFMKDITKTDINNPIVLQTDENYVPIKVSVPFAQNKLYYQGLILGYVDENGKVMDVQYLSNNIDKGIMVPKGKCNIQVMIFDKNYGYNLVKPKYNIDTTSNMITFNESDVTTIKVNINNTSNSEIKLDGMFPFYKDMYSSYNLSRFNGMINTFYITKMNYDFLGFDTIVDNEIRYSYHTPQISAADGTVINLGTKLKAELKFTKSNYLPGEYVDSQFLSICDEFNNRISYIRDNNYNNIMGSLEFKSSDNKITKVDVPCSSYYSVKVPNLPAGIYDVTFKIENSQLAIAPVTSKITIGNSQIVLLEIKSTTPANGDVDVKTDKVITATFNIAVQQGDGFNNISLKDSDGKNIDASVTLVKNTLTIKPVKSLNNSTKYTVIIPKDAVKTADINELGADYSFSFTTEKDKIAPNVVASSMLNNSKGVALNSEIMVLFSETIKEAADYNNIKLTDSKKTEVPLSVTKNDNKLIIKAAKELAPEMRYTLVIPKNSVQDMSDNSLSKEFKMTFTTVVLPKVTKTNPKDDYDKVKLNSKIDISFNINIAPGADFENIKLLDKDNNPVEAIKTIKSKILTIKSVKDLLGSMDYTVVIPKNSIADVSENANRDDYTFNFITVADVYPPAVLSSTPAKSGKDAGIHSDIVLVFNENIKEGTTIGNIELKGSNKEVIPVTYSINENVLTLSLGEGKTLTYKTSYTLTVPIGAVVDASGLEIKKYTLSFKTMNDSSAPSVTKILPKADSINNKVTSSMTITFNKSVYINDTAIKLSDDKGNSYEFSYILKNNVLTIKPVSKLNYQAKVTLLIPKDAVNDFDDTAMEEDYKLVFDTEKDKIAPVVSLSNPANNAIALAENGKIKFIVTFSEAINLLDGSKVTLTDSKSKKVEANILCSVEGNSLIIIVDDTLTDCLKYNLTIGSGTVSDKADTANVFKKTYKITFIKAEK